MDFEFRSASWEAGESENITGYAVVFEQRTVLYKDPETGYEYGEIIDRHALDGADMSDVILRYNHAGRVLARTRNHSLNLAIDDHGLKITADLSGSNEGKDFYNEVKNGLLDKMSFAFHCSGEEWDEQTRTRRVTKIDLLQDVSLVDFAAYDQTDVSVRSKFEALAEPDLTEYRKKQVANVHAEIMCHVDPLIDGDCYRSMEEIKANAGIDFFTGKRHKIDANDRMEAARHDLSEIRKAVEAASGSTDFDAAIELRNRMNQSETALKQAIKEFDEQRQAVSDGAGTVIRTFGDLKKFKNRKEDKTMENEVRSFCNKVIEARTAGSASTMAAVIPDTVMQQYVVESSQNAFLEDASVTSIAHEGNLNLPIAALQTVEQHTENAELTENGYVPSTLEISHDEYCYMTAYSDKGMRTSAETLEKIIKDTCMGSMLKKMDGICEAAVAGLTYTDDTNAVKVTTAPSFDNFVQAAGLLAADYIPAAKWYCNPAVYFGWLLGLKDTNNRPILDPTKKVEDQAFCGFGIRLDSNVPADTIFFGDGHRVHLNYAREPELKSWPDNDHNQQKMSVCTVAGAAAEPGCMVKVYKGA